MLLAAQDDVEEIAGGTGADEQQPARSMAHGLAEQVDHETADDTVAQKMHQVGMQGQGGDQAPPLVVNEDGPAVDGADREPGIVDGPGAGQ